jgi:hypothetical protein
MAQNDVFESLSLYSPYAHCLATYTRAALHDRGHFLVAHIDACLYAIETVATASIIQERSIHTLVILIN